ncbi:hypothetical protein NU09_2582 [Flavobacterium beibuense]|uniref:Uncharacterized protein n=1 Tax=Flavobacterium beibuense TaxID=657326 RepID=A0A444W700_9FLAO|nr:hypothetical protein NU09_2582 [Flavobacterium beibuense]
MKLKSRAFIFTEVTDSIRVYPHKKLFMLLFSSFTFQLL